MPLVNIGLADYPISSVNIDGTGWMLNDMAKYTANTGNTSVRTANTALDGSGTLATILTAAANGTFVKTVTIKAIVAINLAAGSMIRLFIYDGTNTRLFEEIPVPPMAGGASSLFFSFAKTLDLNFNLQAGYLLKASTEAGKEFRVITEGLDWTY